jgi:hypothetical protein
MGWGDFPQKHLTFRRSPLGEFDKLFGKSGVAEFEEEHGGRD